MWHFAHSRKWCFIFCHVQISTFFLEKPWKNTAVLSGCFLSIHFLFSTSAIVCFHWRDDGEISSLFSQLPRSFVSIHCSAASRWPRTPLAVQMVCLEFKHKLGLSLPGHKCVRHNHCPCAPWKSADNLSLLKHYQCIWKKKKNNKPHEPSLVETPRQISSSWNDNETYSWCFVKLPSLAPNLLIQISHVV